MKSEILYELLKTKNPILCDFIYSKYSDHINSYYYGVIKNSFYALKDLDIQLSNFLPEILNSIVNFGKEKFLRHGFLKILKWVIIQKIIMLNRCQNCVKKRILTYANYKEYDFLHADILSFKKMEFKPFFDIFIEDVFKRLAKKKLKKNLLILILKNYKYTEISKILRISVKQIYSMIFRMKKEIIYPIFCKYFN